MKKCMIGKRYGSLVVIEKVKISGKPKTYWRCQWDCGNTCTVEDSHLKNGHTKNCGCRRRIRLQEKRLELAVLEVKLVLSECRSHNKQEEQ